MNDGRKSYYEIQLEQKQLVVILILMVAVCILFFFLGVFYIRGRTPSADRPPTEATAPKTPSASEAAGPIDTAAQADFFEKGGSKENAAKEAVSGGKVVAEGLPTSSQKTKPKPTKPNRSKPRVTGFVVQIAAVSDVSRANKIRNTLTKQGFRAYIETQDSGKEKLYKVRVGPFKKRGDADSAKADLQHAGHKDVFVSEG